MKQIGKRAWIVLVLCFLFIFGVLFFIVTYVKDAPSWATYPTNAHLYNQGKLIGSGDIYDRNGVTLATTRDGNRIYSDDYATRLSTLHLVGDTSGNIKTSLESAYTDKLVGWNYLQGTYSFRKDINGNNITSTIDSSANSVAYNALDGRKGTVGVMNYETGEVVAMVSTPAYDPSAGLTIDPESDEYDGVFINRLMSSAYIPGSIFKLVTATASIENLSGLESRTFHCDGYEEYPGGRITCLHGTAHGDQTFEQALINSCNVTFAKLANELGKDILTDYANLAGAGESINVNRITTARGSFDVSDAGKLELGWAGCGQYTDQINPMAYMHFVSTIANNGEAVAPKIVDSIKSSLGIPVWFNLGSFDAGENIEGSTAARVKSMMRQNVEQSYGDGELSGHNLCAKSGTAEVGGGQEPHSLFTGFLDDPANPYAFIVVVENGGTGSTVAGGIAKTVLASIVN